MLTNTGGYDAPATTRTEDLLGRWGFAREIFHLAANCPKDWPVRIGIHGEWGSGKTSVLRFVENLARNKNHTVIWLDPWGAKNPNAIWRTFIRDLIKTTEQRVLSPDVSQSRLKEQARAFTETIKRTSSFFEKADKFVRPGIDILEQWLEANPNDLRVFSDYFTEHRLIVLIDDLDRTTPTLLPEIFYTLKEIFSLPGFSLVMAFDRNIVGAALADIHKGWKNGEDFLDKIIDFPKWIPSASPQAALELAKKQLKQHSDTLDERMLDMVIEHIPTNPRTLKTFVRNLWGISQEVSRYNPQEIDWPTLLLTQLFKTNWPRPAEKLLLNASISNLRRTARPRGDENTQSETNNTLNETVIAAGVPEKQSSTAASLLNDIVFNQELAPAYSIEQLTFITERPALITHKEFSNFLVQWKRDPTSESIKNWIQHHASNQELPYREIQIGLFELIIDARNSLLNEASNETLAESFINKTIEAHQLTNALKQVCIELGGFTGKEPVLLPIHFIQLYAHILNWASWVKPENYLPLRSAESDLLIHATRETSLHADELLNSLHSHRNRLEDPTRHQHQAPIRQKVETIIAPRVANLLILLFQSPHSIRTLSHTRSRTAEHELLYNGGSIFWSGPTRSLIIKLTQEARNSTIIQGNFIYLCEELCSDHALPNTLASFDPEILKCLWRAATAARINPRLFTSLQRIFRAFTSAISEPLDEPVWWKEASTTFSTQEEE